uniref:CBF1-interacting co-repressor CIR N-terminal domain-containing protein n=1 Tax=Terrapene triunguis TaxID=2587831 RepID=A0A674JAR3_9SAUR
MNILPKKSWHVRNKDNVARVRRDEAQAQDEQRQREARALLAEQEARTEFLRKKARVSALPGPDGGSALAPTGDDSRHVDLFRDLEEGKGSKAGNKEYEEEKRREKERQEKAIGLLTYLGQSAAEAQTSRPWYQEAPDRSREAAVVTTQEQLKGRLDPLREMERHLRKKKGEGKKRKKEKENSAPLSLEQLRRERLQREQAERARAEALLAGRQGEPQRGEEEEPDDRKRRYNSQFNPQLARRPRSWDEREQR